MVIIVNVYLDRAAIVGSELMELAAIFNASKATCPAIMEMCAELAKGKIHGSTAAMQDFCSA